MHPFLPLYTNLAESSLQHAVSLPHRVRAESVLDGSTLDELTAETRSLIDSVATSADLMTSCSSGSLACYAMSTPLLYEWASRARPGSTPRRIGSWADWCAPRPGCYA